MTNMTQFSAADIARILPHRFPFLFVDQVEEFVPGQRIVAIKHFSIDDRAARGNPPGVTVIPTGVILELVTQVGAVLVLERPEMAGKIAMILHIPSARVIKPIEAGDTVRVEAKVVRIKAQFGYAGDVVTSPTCAPSEAMQRAAKFACAATDSGLNAGIASDRYPRSAPRRRVSLVDQRRRDVQPVALVGAFDVLLCRGIVERRPCGHRQTDAHWRGDEIHRQDYQTARRNIRCQAGHDTPPHFAFRRMDDECAGTHRDDDCADNAAQRDWFPPLSARIQNLAAWDHDRHCTPSGSNVMVTFASRPRARLRSITRLPKPRLRRALTLGPSASRQINVSAWPAASSPRSQTTETRPSGTDSARTSQRWL